jgi:hypothetical protein
MNHSLRNLVKIGKNLDPSCRFTWGINDEEDVWIYFSDKEFEIIFYFYMTGKVKSICFWHCPTCPAKYVEKNNIENLFNILNEINLNPTIKEWILFNLDSFSNSEEAILGI